MDMWIFFYYILILECKQVCIVIIINNIITKKYDRPGSRLYSFTSTGSFVFHSLKLTSHLSKERTILLSFFSLKIRWNLNFFENLLSFFFHSTKPVEGQLGHALTTTMNKGCHCSTKPVDLHWIFRLSISPLMAWFHHSKGLVGSISSATYPVWSCCHR